MNCMKSIEMWIHAINPHFRAKSPSAGWVKIQNKTIWRTKKGETKIGSSGKGGANEEIIKWSGPIVPLCQAKLMTNNVPLKDIKKVHCRDPLRDELINPELHRINTIYSAPLFLLLVYTVGKFSGALIYRNGNIYGNIEQNEMKWKEVAGSGWEYKQLG